MVMLWAVLQDEGVLLRPTCTQATEDIKEQLEGVVWGAE